MLTRVGDEHNGRFVRETLARRRRRRRRTSRPIRRGSPRWSSSASATRDTFPLRVLPRPLRRHGDRRRATSTPAFIARRGALLLSGTHLSQPGTLRGLPSRDRSCARRRHARRARHRLPAGAVGTHRPGLGEQRYVASAAVSRQLQARRAAVRPGGRHRGGDPHRRRLGRHAGRAARAARPRARRPLVDEARADGLRRVRGAIPGRSTTASPARASRSRSSTCSAPATRSWPASCAAGCATSRCAGCCALRERLRRARRVAPRLRAGDAERAELEHFLAHGSPTSACARTPRSSTCTARRHAAARTGRRSRCWPSTTARSSRSWRPRADRARAHRALQARWWRGGARRARGGRRDGRGDRAGVIVDDRYGEDVLPAMTGSGWWIARPVELPGSRPLAFEAGAERSRSTLRAWPTRARRQVPGGLPPGRRRRAARASSSTACRSCSAACVATDRELLVEVIPPREHAGDADARWRARWSRSTRPACGPTGGSCRRRATAAAWERIADGDRARTTRSAAACCCSAWRRARTACARASRVAAPQPDLQRLRGRPLDLRRAGGRLVRRPHRRREVVVDASPRATRG